MPAPDPKRDRDADREDDANEKRTRSVGGLPIDGGDERDGWTYDARRHPSLAWRLK